METVPQPSEGEAPGSCQKRLKVVAARKGANGVLLKRFESVMADMFSTSSAGAPGGICRESLRRLTPRYSKLPPPIGDAERRELVMVARRYWKKIGLTAPSDAAPEGPLADGHPPPWPFDPRTALPPIGQVRGDARNGPKKTKTGKDTGGVGDVRDAGRARRKEHQLANMIRITLALIPDERLFPSEAGNGGREGGRALRMVDFAGGTGHLAVPLALLLPHCEVVCVDLKGRSLDLLRQRVDGPFLLEEALADEGARSGAREPSRGSAQHRALKALPNLSTYHGSIQSYPHEFDIGVSLHACGEASDWALRKCLEGGASWAVCSCCCGKLQRGAGNPYVFQSTGGNEKEVRYPQSESFASLGGCGGAAMTPEMFDEIAKAADYGELGDMRKPRNACRRAAKSLVEWDRLLFANELRGARRVGAGSNSILTRMRPWEASPKNDVLVGWRAASSNPYRRGASAASGDAPRDSACDADLRAALRHLLGEGLRGVLDGGENPATGPDVGDRNDWTAREEADVRGRIDEFLLGRDGGSPSTDEERAEGDDGRSRVLRFPPGMGPRMRKLIHYVAEGMGLRHWGEGRKDSEKIVAVAPRG